MFKFLLLIALVLPDRAVPVSAQPYATRAACEKARAEEMVQVRAANHNNLPYVSACLPITTPTGA